MFYQMKDVIIILVVLLAYANDNEDIIKGTQIIYYELWHL